MRHRGKLTIKVNLSPVAFYIYLLPATLESNKNRCQYFMARVLDATIPISTRRPKALRK